LLQSLFSGALIRLTERKMIPRVAPSLRLEARLVKKFSDSSFQFFFADCLIRRAAGLWSVKGASRELGRRLAMRWRSGINGEAERDLKRSSQGSRLQRMKASGWHVFVSGASDRIDGSAPLNRVWAHGQSATGDQQAAQSEI
jgi:hypothetical protein